MKQCVLNRSRGDFEKLSFKRSCAWHMTSFSLLLTD
jgi:hypothetical protein